MVESAKETLLAELAALCGLVPDYYDIAGRRHVTEPIIQAAILTAMGCRCQTAADLHQELERRRRSPWTNLVEPVLALFQSRLPAAWNLYLPLSGGGLPPNLEITWNISDETGHCLHTTVQAPELQVAEIRSFGEAAYGRVMLLLPPDLDLGYYDIQVWVSSSRFQRQARMLLIIAPDQMYIPESLVRERLWGINLPLYAIRSTSNWGIGDCGDVQRFLTLGSRFKAGIIGLNPLHHLGVNLHDSISPYYPTSRCYSSPLYLDLNLVPEMSACPEAQDFMARSEVLALVEVLRQGRQVNYPEVARLKFTVLAMLLDAFVKNHGLPSSPQTERCRDFAAFLERRGESLRHFATFLALSEYWQTQEKDYRTWQEWPAAYHDPTGPTVAEFARCHERQLLLHAYAQWLLAGQLQETQAEARTRNLSLGLYFDLAVGVNPGGFDTWENQELFALGLDIGAPPDDFSPLGQNWGLAPLSPQQLRAQGYDYFIKLLRQNCPAGGALRIDHVMGLFRLYWIPRGASPAQGAYIRYPAEEMLKILALESVRQQTAIIGEDLGTVAPYIREQLTEYRVMSTRLFYFERQGNGDFNRPSQYPEWALASITTHDLPTLAGFWQGRDIDMRQQLNLFPDAQAVDRSWEDRRRAKAAIIDLLRDKGWFSQEIAEDLSAQAELPEQVKWGVISHMAQTPCRLILLSLEDIFSWLDQQNLPGTKDEYPNWRLKLPMLLEEIANAPEMEQAAQIVHRFCSSDKPETVKR
jgi:4-alpha-glucanotransferase